MKMLRKAAALALCASLCALPLNACGHKEVTLEGESILNFTPPAEGEDIVVLTIKDYGEVKIKLFPEESPKGVENFTKLVEEGFYDELIFHRVIADFMIQGGDPKGDGNGGRDAWGGNGFSQTISGNLHHFAGAVAYAINPQERLNKSQFYIVTGDEASDETLDKVTKFYQITFSKRVREFYNIWGGAPHLDTGYEIFGQVFDGLEYCLEIQNVPRNSNDKPKTPVVIEKAEVVPYDGSTPEWLNWKGENPN